MIERMSWEMHTVGDEVVLCTAGRMTLHQQHADGTTATVEIGPRRICHKSAWLIAYRRRKWRSDGFVHRCRFGDRTPGAVTQSPPRHASTGNTYNISALRLAGLLSAVLSERTFDQTHVWPSSILLAREPMCNSDRIGLPKSS